MSKRDIVISLAVKAKDAVAGLNAFEKGLDGLGKKSEKTGGLLSRLGDNVGGNVTGKLGKAGDAANALGLGLDDLDGTTAVVGAGLTAFAGFVAGGVSKMKELYDQTRDFNEVAGTSWEEGSRLIAVFDDLRVSSDEGAQAMGKLTQTVGTAPEKLAEYGIEVARAKDGTVDMAGTLANVATAFQKTTDPAKKAALGSELFGKSWKNMVPVLEQGGGRLRDLVAAVDESQVATAEGAKQQDELFEATDDLHDAIDGLQRTLAKDAIPRMAEFAENATQVVNAISEVNKVIPIMDVLMKSLPGAGQVSMTKEAWAGLKDEFSTVGEKVGPMASGLKDVNAQFSVTGQVTGAAAEGLKGLNSEAKTTIVRAKDAKKEYDDFKRAVQELLDKQEEMRRAQLESEDSTLALEEAQVAAGDASWELSDSAHEVENAVRDYGAESEEAAIATEEHNRKLREARGAMNDSAAAAVEHAKKVAEGNGVTLTAAQETQIYRDELLRLRQGAEDPALAAAMDAQIERLRLTAERAQEAKEDVQGLNEALAASSGIEANFTGRNRDGTAVIRRATGGPVWPGQTAYVHQDELINFPSGSGPAHVLSAPEAARFMSDPANGFMGLSMPKGGLARGPAPGTAIRPMGFQSPLGLGADFTSDGMSLRSSTFAGGGGTINYNITINGYADISKLIDAIRAYERARA